MKSMAKMKILKFGGSSLGNAERIRNAAKIILATKKSSGKIAVVVSAFADTTDDLLRITSMAAQGNESYKKLLEKLKSFHRDTAESLMQGKNSDKTLKYIDEIFREIDGLL